MALTARQRVYLGLIVLVYVALGVLYMLATPPLESSDEYKHYPVVQYVQSKRALPILDPDSPGLWLQEAVQPPLYYIFMGMLTIEVDTDDLTEVHQVNPHAFVGNPNQIRNKNLIIHQREREPFPGQGTIKAIYLIRLASIGLGIGTVVLSARLGALLFSPQVGLLAAALTAFNPMFLFISAAVNNDSLAILLGHWGLYLLVQLWQQAPDPRSHWRRYSQAGLVIGLGILTKLSLSGLLVVAGLALAWWTWRRRQWRWLLVGGSNILVVTLMIAGWWFVRNWQLYGDPTGLNAFIAVQGVRDQPITWSGWVDEFGTFFRSYWGLFGGVNVASPQPFYWISNLLLLTGAVGLARWLWQKRHPSRSGIWLPLAWSGLLLASLIRWNLISPAFQGRLIFPALGAINGLWAKGLLSWVRKNWHSRLTAGLAGAWLFVATALPWISIRPAYAFPSPLSRVPAAAQFGPITFAASDGSIQLVGVEMLPVQSVEPGAGPVEVVLYWQVSQLVTHDYVTSVHLLGRELRSVGQVDRYPAWGMVPTSRWQVGQIYRDEYHVYVNEAAVAPAQLRIAVSMFDAKAGDTLPAAGPDGQPLELLLVGEPVRLAASAPIAAPENELDAAFAEGISLAGYELMPNTIVPGAEVMLTLYWRANGTPSQDYTVFVHLVDAGQQQLAGADSPPVANDYPISLWRAGDWIDDVHVMSIPPDLAPGEYRIKVGLYDPDSGLRLNRLNDQGDSVEFGITISGS